MFPFTISGSYQMEVFIFNFFSLQFFANGTQFVFLHIEMFYSLSFRQDWSTVVLFCTMQNARIDKLMNNFFFFFFLLLLLLQSLLALLFKKDKDNFLKFCLCSWEMSLVWQGSYTIAQLDPPGQPYTQPDVTSGNFFHDRHKLSWNSVVE